VTSRVDQIEKLIADIDNLLNIRGKRLSSRLLSGQNTEAREVLETIRKFLVQERESEISNTHHQNNQTGEVRRSPLLEKFVNQSNKQSLGQQNQPEQEQGNVLIQQLKSELSSLIQPLQAELAAMMQERENLVQEIRQLEQKRLHNYSLSQQYAHQEQMISEFLQLLMSRVASTLTPQMADSSANQDNYSSIETASLATPDILESSEKLQKLTYLTGELDQRLLSLDGTVNFVFEALQRNINTYYESLSQGLAKMHSTGVQGQQFMVNFLHNLTQHLQQQAQIRELSFPDLETSQPPFASASLPIPTKPIPTNTTAPELAPQDYTSGETSQSWGFSLPEAEQEDVNDVSMADDLDAMLLDLSVDDSSSFDKAKTAQQDDLELVGDEVDQLYASLLDTDHVNDLRVDQENLSSSHITETQPTFVIHPSEPEVMPENNITESTLASRITPITRVPDPWLEQADAELESWTELFFEEDTNPEKWGDFSGSSSTAVMSPDNLSVQPSSADTITALSELFTEEQKLEIASSWEAAAVIAHSQQLQVATPNQEDGDLDNYIPASPQENLLASHESQSANVADITLDEEQIQQLNQDLANFDELNVDYDTPNLAESNVELREVKPISWPQTEADLDFSPTNKDEITVSQTSADQQSSFGGADSVNGSVNSTNITPNMLDSVWYLGVDVGTSGISAALLNRSTAVVYPICWSAENQQRLTSFPLSFRLPAEVYLPTSPQGEAERGEAQKMAENHQHNFYSVQLKPYLHVAIPYKNEQQRWEPVLQFNQFSAGPLTWVVRSLSKLLLTLKSDRYSTTQGLIASAVGLSHETFRHIINNIAGVVCTCPFSWSEQYRFNVREAVLNSQLVSHPQQIFFVEEAIASLLSILDGADGETVQISDSEGLHPVKSSYDSLVGNSFVINIGASTTEMTLVDLPDNLQELKHDDFMLHSFAYAGNGIEQDIICQLLLPPDYRQPRQINSPDNTTTTNNSWQWQNPFPGLEQMRWESLGLEELDLPQVAEPDMTARIRLQQKLESSLLGRAVLDAALALKLILQQQDSFTLELADVQWVLQRRDLENRVFAPFVRSLNREFNKLLAARGITTEAINQAIITGGGACLGAVNYWLRQKLPHTKIIQYLYLGENGAPNCSRVAYGLATLPLHPQVLEQPKQHYTDYFLFMELLRLVPDRTVSFGEILQLFEDSGINTSICQRRLLAFLENELPPGLIPAIPDSTWLSSSSRNNRDYKAIASAPLFEKQGNLSYRPNFSQVLVLQTYLNAIKASTKQPINEPYTVNFAVQVTD
jgi:hypothetical protein